MNEFLLSTTAPQVSAAGDVAGQHQHTPAVLYEGTLVAHNALRGNQRAVDFRVIPTAVFTFPALAQVGLIEAEARAQGLGVVVSRASFDDSSAAALRGQPDPHRGGCHPHRPPTRGPG